MFVIVSKKELKAVTAGTSGNGVIPPDKVKIQTGGNGVIPPTVQIGTDPFDPKKTDK
ncbi:hypothetical protein [Pseudoalteromonas phenolica]|uniref:hypothetical protein n=1 Tax=Pseudoalteromonas phenolica TaxID=161398 RepID=UPI001485C672|nr:hypothetical protein [Pseudoalteromonas phenolica]